jgi:hypothetical protein
VRAGQIVLTARAAEPPAARRRRRSRLARAVLIATAMRSSLLALALLATVGPLGCKGGDQPSTAAAGKPAAPDQPAAGKPAAATEPFTLAAEAVIVEAQVPKGWTRSDLGAETASFAEPGGGIFKSTITIGTSCAGACETRATNGAALADAQLAGHKNAGYSAEVTKTTPLPDGGIELEFTVTKEGWEPMYQVIRYVPATALPTGAQCTAMGIGADAAAVRDRLRASCATMTVRAKA